MIPPGKKIYCILMEGSNNIFFVGNDRWDLKPVLFNHTDARRMLFRCQELMKDKSTALKGIYKPVIKRWDYLFNGISPNEYAKQKRLRV